MPELRPIVIRGARAHNLKNVSVTLPAGRLVVVTGVSGSGKSSLAFDTLYAEGNRRYLESLSTYARQFLGEMKRAECDRIDGLSPAIAIEQKTVAKNPRSTVGTVTEIYDHLRLLWARVGRAHCPKCDRPLERATPSDVVERILEAPGRKSTFLAPMVRGEKGTFSKSIERLRREGYQRIRLDGVLHDLTDLPQAQKTVRHDLDCVVDVFTPTTERRARVAEAVERSFRLAGGLVILDAEGGAERAFYESAICPKHGTSSPELDPKHFSFNSPHGACPRCDGLGVLLGELPPRDRFGRRKIELHIEWEEFLNLPPCPACGGARLAPIPRHVRVASKRLPEIARMPMEDLDDFLAGLKWSPREAMIAERILEESRARLAFLKNVGLGYLTIDRAAATLSGGEAQRIRLAAQLGSRLQGVLYCLDEPSIGLHPSDTERLLATLEGLRDLGNTVVVVEHDQETIERADWVVDIGPGAGRHGGTVIAEGTPETIRRSERSLTGAYLSGRRRIEVPATRRTPRGFFTLAHAARNNLKDLTVRFPIGTLVSVTGVSGSGKSSLVLDTLLPALHKTAGAENLSGHEVFEKTVVIDQAPIGRTSRSNPATYTGIFTHIRELFSRTPEARARGYEGGRFSFNVKGGRCGACDGAGSILVEMHFLPDVHTPCEKCGGARYNPETLEIKYRGKNIADVLAMTVEEALEFFTNHTTIRRGVEMMRDVGLGYLTLGQGAPTLSGGEAQRLKLATELQRVSHGKSLYLLDEPTTGLHFEDIRCLLGVLDRFADRGDTVLVIEHHPDVIAHSDWVIDLGPGGGNKGGEIVAEGPPEAVADARTFPRSLTGRSVREVLDRAPRAARGGRSDGRPVGPRAESKRRKKPARA